MAILPTNLFLNGNYGLASFTSHYNSRLAYLCFYGPLCWGNRLNTDIDIPWQRLESHGHAF
jgi:hypothetical protein